MTIKRKRRPIPLTELLQEPTTRLKRRTLKKKVVGHCPAAARSGKPTAKLIGNALTDRPKTVAVRPYSVRGHYRAAPKRVSPTVQRLREMIKQLESAGG